MLSKLLVIFALLALCFGDDVQQLGDADFDQKIASYDTVLVMFYAPWCGHCKRLKPEFEKAAPILKSNDPPVILAKVDCIDDGKDTCDRFSVSSYPTLKIFKGGELSADYNGPREANVIVKYMRSQVGPASKELLTEEAVDHFLGSPEVGIVFFGGESKLNVAEEESESSGSGFGRGNSRQSSVNSAVDDKLLKKVGKKKSVNSAVDDKLLKKVGKKKPGLFKGLGSMFRFGKHRKSIDNTAGLPTKNDVEVKGEVDKAEMERLAAARRQQQEDHDRMQEQYRRMIETTARASQRLDPVPSEPKPEVRHMRSHSYDLYGDSVGRPGSRTGYADPHKYAHYVNYEQIQQHLR